MSPPSLQIEFRGPTQSFGPVQVLHGVDFAVPPGQVLGLLGENGAGKSTLMKILAGFEQASGGAVLLNGQPLALTSSRDAEARGIVLIHQEFSLA
jgi:ribose transport system ATP-binding protein